MKNVWKIYIDICIISCKYVQCTHNIVTTLQIAINTMEKINAWKKNQEWLCTVLGKLSFSLHKLKCHRIRVNECVMNEWMCYEWMNVLWMNECVMNEWMCHEWRSS